jgi:hypothetical protein
LFDLDLTKPIILQQHEALLERISENHPKRPEIQRKKDILNAGYNGEKTLNYFLGLLPPKKYHIFQGLRLPIGKNFFQIDAYLLSPKLSFAIENKNYAGTLLFEKNQLTQTINATTNIFQNPITQVNRHKILLKYQFEKYQIPFPPIEHLACISNTSTLINISPGYYEAEKRVCKAVELIKKIDENEKMYKKDIVDQKTTAKIRRFLLSKHTPYRINILETYGINKREIITGVLCPECKIPMEYKHGLWKCPCCRLISKDSFLQAIQDYFLIVKPTITNSELREFLNLPSPRATANILTSGIFTFSGNNKGRIYYLHPIK